MTENSGKTPLYTLSGKVIHGRGIGKLVGMPTANLQVSLEHSLPPVGVYITEILLDRHLYYGVTNIGPRPTTDNDNGIFVESHILDFDEDIYEKNIKIRLYKKLRFPKKFDNFSMLLDQIRMDCAAAQEFFGIKPVSSDLFMSIQKHQVKIDQQEVFLSPKEFDILYMLYSNPDITYTKEQLYEAIWHEPSNGCFHAVENTIFQIRKKLKVHSPKQDFIRTVVGYGYKFNPK